MGCYASTVFAVVEGPFVCLSVHLSVTSWYCVKTLHCYPAVGKILYIALCSPSAVAEILLSQSYSLLHMY